MRTPLEIGIDKMHYQYALYAIPWRHHMLLEEMMKFINEKFKQSTEREDINGFGEVYKFLKDQWEGNVAKPEPLTKEEILHWVLKPVYVDDGLFCYWRVLKEIHVHKNAEFILNFTDSAGGINFDEIKIYPYEWSNHDKVQCKEN